MPATDLSMFECELDSVEKVIAMTETYAKQIQKLQTGDMQIINVEKTMKELVQVGTLLMVADKTSDGFNVNVAIKKMLMTYQMLLRDCVDELGYFKQATKYALELHVEAVELMEAEEPGDALKTVSECIKYANKLATKAQALVVKSDALIAESHVALSGAAEQDVRNQESKAEIEKLKKKTQADKAKRDTLDKELALEVAEYRKKESAAIARADAESNKAFNIAVISTICSVFGGGSGKKGESSSDSSGKIKREEEKKEQMEEERKTLEKKREKLHQDIEKKEHEQTDKDVIKGLKERLISEEKVLKEKSSKIKNLEKKLDKLYETFTQNAANAEANAIRIADLLHEKRKQEIENKSELAKLAVEINNAEIDLGDVKTAIKMIKLTVHTLGKISTALNNTSLFWKQQAKTCERLEEIGSRTEGDLKTFNKNQKEVYLTKAKKGIKNSGMRWLTLFKINSDASAAIQPAFDNINSIMCNLGGMETKEFILSEAHRVLASLAASSQQEITDDNEHLRAIEGERLE